MQYIGEIQAPEVGAVCDSVISEGDEILQAVQVRTSAGVDGYAGEPVFISLDWAEPNSASRPTKRSASTTRAPCSAAPTTTTPGLPVPSGPTTFLTNGSGAVTNTPSTRPPPAPTSSARGSPVTTARPARCRPRHRCARAAERGQSLLLARPGDAAVRACRRHDAGGSAADSAGARKPDLTASDCGINTFFDQSDGSDYRFCGTSAAAPHAAAIAALLWQQNPNLTSDQMNTALESTATVASSTHPAGACAVSGAHGATATYKAGSCVLNANQSGNAAHHPAAKVSRTVAISAAPAVTTKPLPSGVVGKK